MPPLVIDVMTAHKAALLRQEQQQMTAMAQQWRRVEDALQDQVELFARRVADDRLNPSQLRSRQFQLDRYQSLLAQVRIEFDKYTNYADALITERQRTLGRTAITNAGQAIRAVATEAGVRIGFDVLPITAIENMVGLAGNGSPLRDLLVDSYGVASDGMLNQLIRATALGKNPRVTARAMVREGLSQSLNRMMVTARTEQLRVYRESSRMAYQASGVVEKHRRLATRDSRTCPACLMLDGEEMELDQPLREHPQGRCTTIPVVTGLPTVEWEKGPDWFRRQPPDVQRSILGKGRYDAWAAGQFDLDQLVSVRQDSTWGDSVQPTPLRDLLGGSATPITIRRSAPATPIAPVVPIQRQPKGTPVANALQVPESGKYRAQYQAAIDAIAEVHGDGKLPEIPIKTKSDMDSFGYYAHYSDGTPQEIAIRGTGDHMELTLAHEIGHFLDHQGIAAPSHFASVDSDVMQEWRNAVMQSEAVKDLQAKLADPVSYEREIEYQGRRFIASPDPLYLRYNLDEKEVWARSYAQYIALRSNNQPMLEQVAEQRKIELYESRQWADDDFAPVAEAIDRLFERLGWQQ